MASWQSYVVKASMRQLKKRVTDSIDDIPRLRREKEYYLGKLWMPGGVETTPLQIQHLSAEWFEPSGIKNKQVLLYLHGGGYAIGSVKAYRSLIGRIAKSLGMRTLAINYRKAPEHPFPAALEDALLSYSWLLEEEGLDPEDVFIAGDSAGGGLTVSTLMALRDMGAPQPLGAMLLCPWTDLAGTGRSLKTKAEIDPILPACRVRAWGRMYAGSTDVRHPLISPLYGDLRDLAPMFVQVGTSEIVLDDSTRLAQRAIDSGAKLELDVWEKMPHVWHFCWHFMPESRQAIDQLAHFTRKRIAEVQQLGESQRQHRPRVSVIRHAFEAGRLSAAILSAAIVRGVF